MTEQDQRIERRSHPRVSLRVPLVVAGAGDDHRFWAELTETDDLSATGVQFHLLRPVESGQALHLRASKPNGSPVEVVAAVMHLTPGAHGAVRIGARVLEGVDQWAQLYESWIGPQLSGQTMLQADQPG
jgi:hypothetical protein